MSNNDRPSSDNKIIYQLNLNNKSLGLVNPYLFVERLKDEIILKIPNVKVKVNYNTKGNSPYLLQLKCFCSKSISLHQLGNIEQEISFIVSSLESELTEKIQEARSSVV